VAQGEPGCSSAPWVRKKPDPLQWTAPAASGRLERIVTNLLSNGLKYSEPGTPVTVRLNRHDGEMITSVTDRGPGIPPEDLPHLFERYFRSTPNPRP